MRRELDGWLHAVVEDSPSFTVDNGDVVGADDAPIGDRSIGRGLGQDVDVTGLVVAEARVASGTSRGELLLPERPSGPGDLLQELLLHFTHTSSFRRVDSQADGR